MLIPLEEKIHDVRAYCLVWCMMHVGYKALGSYPRAHEKLNPFKQLANKFFFVAKQRGEKANAMRQRSPRGY